MALQMYQLQQHHHTGSYELLSTKLAPPQPRPALVARDALLARLDAGLAHKLTLLSAPAGFGKTTLVSQWLASRSYELRIKSVELILTDSTLNSQLSTLNSQVAWVALDAGDNDPVRFWRYVIGACQAFDTTIGTAALALLHAPQPSFELALTALINDLARLSGKYVLVLEDYHAINARQIHESLAFLLDHLPATLHLIITTRSDPPLPLARLRAHNELCELHAEDLRFSPAETHTFLQQASPLPLTPGAITRLEARAEGWVAGLRLLALAIQGRQGQPEIESFLATFSGSHRHIWEYLVTEVLGTQPEPIQNFLLRTSVLNQLAGSLCDAVTGRSDSQLILDQIEHANLFLVPLDGARQWYRYHGLFAEAMRHEAHRRLGEAGMHTLYDKAGRWYEQHGQLAEAVEAALAARAFARVAELIERIIEAQSHHSEIHTLLRWIEHLPAEMLQERPAICFAHAIAILFTSDRGAPATRARLQPLLQQAEHRCRATGNQARLGELLAFRAMAAWWQGDHAQTFADARQALELLPEQETHWRGISMLNVGMEALQGGRVDAARRTLLEARSLCEAAGNSYAARACVFVLGDVCMHQGTLHQAEQLYRQVIAQAGEDVSDRAHALIGLAGLAYEWNDLAAAEQHVSAALEIAGQHADLIGRQHVEDWIRVPATLILVEVLHARGETARAQQQLQALLALTCQARRPQLHRAALACQARLAQMEGDLATVRRWAAAWLQSRDGVAQLQQEREGLIEVRLRIAQGDITAALNTLAHWQAGARTQARVRSELEIMILTALAQAVQGDQPQARETLLQALALAQPEGYRRLFLDEGPTLVTLLQSIVPDVRKTPLAGYVQMLLSAGAPAHTPPVAAPPPELFSPLLIEPLSPQEQRVLRLLAAGLSNPEIAQELVVSVNTVKTQVQSIYRKLNVTSRREARAAARVKVQS